MSKPRSKHKPDKSVDEPLNIPASVSIPAPEIGGTLLDLLHAADSLSDRAERLYELACELAIDSGMTAKRKDGRAVVKIEEVRDYARLLMGLSKGASS
jgi:hypothetical protein